MDRPELEAALRSAYEWSRLRHATVQASALLLPVALVVAWSPRTTLASVLGFSLIVAATVLWWRGELFGRGVLPGLLAGGVPFLFASLAMQCGTGCTVNGHCVPWCVPACAVGGVVAALLIARTAPKSADAPRFWLAAGVIANLTGALGCSCYSVTGTFAVLVAFMAVSMPAFVLARRGAR